jgi:hypothetical protein
MRRAINNYRNTALLQNDYATGTQYAWQNDLGHTLTKDLVCSKHARELLHDRKFTIISIPHVQISLLTSKRDAIKAVNI